MRYYRSILGTAIAALIAGCAGPASSPATLAEPTREPVLSPVATASPVAAFRGRDAILVVGRTGAPDLEAIQASTGEAFMRLPDGIPTSVAWGNIATATVATD